MTLTSYTLSEEFYSFHAIFTDCGFRNENFFPNVLSDTFLSLWPRTIKPRCGGYVTSSSIQHDVGNWCRYRATLESLHQGHEMDICQTSAHYNSKMLNLHTDISI